MTLPQEGWYPDPELRGIDRWWSGTAWTPRRRNTPNDVRTVGSTATPAGWYADPELHGVERWWDGQAWSDHRRNA